MGSGGEATVQLASGERIRIVGYPAGFWFGLESGIAIPADNQTDITWEEWDRLVMLVAQVRERSGGDDLS